MAAARSLPFFTIVATSTLFALILAVVPLPMDYASLRPEMLCLVVIYWIIHMPQRIGMLYAWCVGLAQDVIETNIWGAHGMALVVIAYICLLSYQRLQNYSIWHQALWIFIFVGLHQVIVNWVHGLVGYNSEPHELILSTVSSALCWPLVVIILGYIRRIYRVS